MTTGPTYKLLAANMRPRSLEEFIGQQHLVAKGKPLRVAVEKSLAHSMILWGPPGVGKTSLAMLIAKLWDHDTLSATLTSSKEIRAVVEKAARLFSLEQKPTLVFIDEIHRFNKAQQDLFLPILEDGSLILIGATTENPSFELNNALLSRLQVYVLQPLRKNELQQLLDRALRDEKKGLGLKKLQCNPGARELIIQAADGDARKLLNTLEIISDLSDNGVINNNLVQQALTKSYRRFDKKGEIFYHQISALHKSIRGSSPDATLYWLARMIDGGCDPLYLARRIVRIASEDIGNADPRALTLALNAWEVQQRLGSPEGELALAQAAVYLSCAPKSNAVYKGFMAAMADSKRWGSLEVPVHLRNANTTLMKKLNYGKHYRYAHDECHAYAAGWNYFPNQLAKKRYYFPKPYGLEIKIAQKLAKLRQLDEDQLSNS